jgi:hypothetical protein
LATENPPGDTDASTANSPASATRSAPPLSGESSRLRASIRRPDALAPRGPSSWEPRRTAPWPATCSTSTPSHCSASTRSLRSSTPPAASTSSESPRTRPARGLPNWPAT